MKSVAVFALAILASPAFAVPARAQEAHGVHPANMDPSAVPGDNWYEYANGDYLAHTEIPSDRTSISGFSTLADIVNKRVANIIQAAAASNPAPGSEKKKIADLYASYLDEKSIDAHGLESLKPHLTAIDAIRTQHDLAHALGLTLRADVDALNNTNFHTANLFGIWVAPGFNDPDHYAPYLMQGGLELPTRDYYLTDSPRMASIRAKYLTHIAAMLKLSGVATSDSDAASRAQAIFDLETAIAKSHISLAASEDIAHANNPWKASDFSSKAPGLDWATYFSAAGLGKQPGFIVWQPTDITAEAALVATTPISTWKSFLAYHLIEQYATAISTPLANERFAFTGTVLTGATQQRPRDQRAVLLVNQVLGDAVGKLYAAQYFPPEEKAKVEEMVHNLLAAFRVRLENLTWMAPDTKAEALRKLGTLKVGIGYADKWRSYAALNISPTNLFSNLWNASNFEYQSSLARIGQPTDRSEWTMTPQTVNAVNLPLDNGLNFPAAIFGPPFFDPAATDAANYGAIGSVIGHEISHTFDSEGASFDSQGKVRNWWTDADRKHFDDSIEALAKQYDAYAPFPDLHLNGRQTLGENIADLAGITASFDAWQTSLHGKAAPTVPGPDGTTLSGVQQFFLGFAQSEAGKSREAALRQQVLTDPHSPSQYRADTVRNLDAWYAPFDVKPGQTLYLTPDQRVHIW
jgi:endothelin-converting enzyme/putative endopeptidase